MDIENESINYENLKSRYSLKCSFCKEEDATAVLNYRPNEEIKLLGINCIFEKAGLGQIKKEDCKLIGALINSQKEEFSKIVKTFEMMKSINLEFINELEEDRKELRLKNQANEIDSLEVFLETMTTKVQDLKLSDNYKENLKVNQSVLKVEKLANRVVGLSNLVETVKLMQETKDTTFAFLLFSSITDTSFPLNSYNFDGELKSFFFELMNYSNEKDKIKNELRSNNNTSSSGIPHHLAIELQNNMTQLKQTFNKIQNFILKKDASGGEKSNSHIPDNFSINTDLTFSNHNGTNGTNRNYNNFTDHSTIIENKTFNNNIRTIENKFNSHPAVIENNYNKPQETISSTTYANSHNNLPIKNDNLSHQVQSNQREEKESLNLLGNNKTVINDSNRYIIFVDIPNLKSHPPIRIFDTSENKFYEKNITKELSDASREILTDSRYINTGNGFLLCGGNSKPTYSKQCFILQVENCSSTGVDVFINSYNNLFEGRKRHNLILIKSLLFDKERKRPQTAVLAISGFKTTTCEFTMLDSFSEWKQFASLNYSRSNGSLLVMNDCVYIFGGHMVITNSQEEYLNSCEYYKLSDLVSSSGHTPDVWNLVHFKSSSMLDKCAFSVIYNCYSLGANKEENSQMVMILGGFKSESSNNALRVKLSSKNPDEDWEIKDSSLEIPDKLFFLNNNFVLGENGLYYSFSYSGALISFEKSVYNSSSPSDCFKIIK